MRIQSRDNEQIKALVRLRKSPEERKSAKCLLLDGARLCYDAYRSGRRLEQLYATDEAAEKYAEYLRPLREHAESYCEISSQVAEKLSETPSPQGVFSVCASEGIVRPLTALKTGKYIGCEHVQDPGNLGTILRTAAAFGADGVVMTEDCVDWSSQKVIRSAMGALFRVPIYFAPDVRTAVEALHVCGVESWAAVLAPDAVDFRRWTPRAAALWVGNEGNGLTPEAVSACDGGVTIPMAGGVESLNAAICAAVLIWRLTQE